MPSFGTRGSAGPSIPSIWFGALPDRLSFLTPNIGGISGTINPVGGAVVPANLANQWTLNACAFGATSAAPDGTTNAQAIVEDTSNGQHYISCTTGTSGNGFFGGTGPLRMAGFYKPNGRRIVFKFVVNADVNNNAALYAVFDLAGGQVGVQPTIAITGSPNPSVTITPLTAHISPAPNGFFLCSMDFSAIFGGGVTVTFLTMLDNGTGTGALSNSYVGTGSSGTIGWRTTVMPVQTFAMNNVTYFQDFNGTVASTIDVNNTQAPGFDLYVSTNWPGFSPGQSPLTAAAFSIANSILTVTPNVGNSNGFSMSTNTLLPSTFTPVGRAFKAPFLWEIRAAYGLDVGVLGQHLVTMWSLSQEWESANGINPTNPTVSYGRELGFGEMDSGGGTNFNGGSGFIQGPLTTFPPASTELNTGGFSTYAKGMPPYYTLQSYGSGLAVEASGTRYFASTFVPAGNPPPNASFWAVFNYPSSGLPSYPPSAVFDFTQMHVYSALQLPYYGASQNAPGSPEQIGTQWLFIDGLMVSKSTSWAPGGGGGQLSPYPHIVDGQSYGIFFSCDTVGGPPCHYDWIRVTQ